MKIKIGPYKKWIGPYQLAEMIPFISEDRADRIGEWLANTWVADVCQWFYSKQERKIKVHIDKWDTWDMDHTLSLIILPMLKQLQATKHGSPIVDDEDVPVQLRYSDPKGEYGIDNWVHYKWEWVLKELVWTFENLVDDSWEEQFHHGEIKDKLIPIERSEDTEFVSTNDDYWVDWEGMKQYNERIQNGLRLFGKYYRNLWD